MDNGVKVALRELNHVSYSYLHLWACPWATFLRYELGIRVKPTIYLALGNALHLALERTHQEGLWDFTKARGIFRHEYNRIIDEEEVAVSYVNIKKYEKVGIEILEVYDAQVQAGTISQENLVVEKEFKLPIKEGLDIVGKIDKIELFPDDEYEITDYKSGSGKPDPWFLRHDLQFTAYAWAGLEIYGKLPRKMWYHHLRSGIRFETVRDLSDIENLKRMIQNVLDMRDQGIRYRIYHDKICGQCDFRGDVCDDKELESRLAESGLRAAL
jgi:CRISPR/Cas system-associated exonuclease Cas4 (RecB family)